MAHKKLGQGTYGCVFKPSLPCKENNVKYDNKVSKLMRKIDADDEFEEYKILNRIKGLDEYAITKPIKCSPKDSNELKSSIQQCYKEKNYNTKNFSILIYEDGGKNLEQFLSIDNFRELESQGEDLKKNNYKFFNIINYFNRWTNIF